ncbi:MAG: thiolase domain-containing protein [Promethearchaeati archaeon SRVP18_Atabeyarchaeia-1]
MRKVVVTGVGMTKVDQHFDKGLKEMFKEASSKALEDSGNPVLDHVYVANAYADMISGQADLGPLLMDYCSAGCIPVTQIGGACGSGGSAIVDGFEAVASGNCDTVMVAGVEKMSDVPTKEATAIQSICEDQEYEANFGLTLAGINAMAARSYMQQYSATREQFSLFSVLMHKNAVKNPYACLPFEVTTEKVAESFPVADPLTFLDSSPLCDGAAAVIIASADAVPETSGPRVEVAAVSQSIDCVRIAERESLLSMRSTVAAAARAYELAKVKATDIDVCEIHDSFTITGFIALEDLSFVERGKTGIAVEEGILAKDGRIPTNPSGGLKARGHPGGATGIYQLAEITLQLRGEAGGMQVDDVEIGLTHNISGFGSRATVGILKRLS